jgi:hypothetical protein
MNQVKSRINQSTVKIEDQQLDRVRVELAVEFDHSACFRINDEWQHLAISSRHLAISPWHLALGI